jgi:putative NIF3 family GTP cyclohydrolase 1 type 2
LAPTVQFSDACKSVRRVAVLGGDGKEDIAAAKAVGADTFLTGNLRHDQMTDAPECGMNLVTAGHFHTEHPVCSRLCELVREADCSIHVTVVNSDPVKTV